MLWYDMVCYVNSMVFYGMVCYAMVCYVMVCYVMVCYAMVCYAMVCYALVCYGMLCYGMLWFGMLWFWYGFAQCFAMVWYVCIALFFPISFVTLQTPGANLGGAQAEGRGRATLPQRGEIRGLAQGTEDSRGLGQRKFILSTNVHGDGDGERETHVHTRKMDGWVDR